MIRTLTDLFRNRIHRLKDSTMKRYSQTWSAQMILPTLPASYLIKIVKWGLHSSRHTYLCGSFDTDIITTTQVYLRII